MPPPQMEPKSGGSGVGPIAGAAIVVILLIAGGHYYWGLQINSAKMGVEEVPYIPNDEQTAPPIESAPSSDSSAGLPSQSSSDDTASIEADMKAMNMDQLNAQNQTEIDNLDQ